MTTRGKYLDGLKKRVSEKWEVLKSAMSERDRKKHAEVCRNARRQR